MNLTRDQVKALDRKREQPKREPGELLAVFVAGPVVNPLRGALSGAHWSKRRKLAKTKREAACQVILEALPRQARRAIHPPDPKRVTFTIYGHNPMDDDNRRAACKPYRDALKDMGVIDDDADRCGHAFDYPSVIVSRGKAKKQGLEIRVSLLPTEGIR